MTLKRCALISAFALASSLSGQTTSADRIRRVADSTFARRLDSLGSAADRRIHAMYDSTLARNNAALATQSAALSVVVSTLSALFTLGGIVAAVLIYRQSQDYKQRVSDALRAFDTTANAKVLEYRVLIDAFIAEKNAEMQRLNAAAAVELERLKKHSEAASIDQQERVKINEKMERLRKEMMARRPINPWPQTHDVRIGAKLPLSGTATAEVRAALACPECKTTFPDPRDPSQPALFVVCPRCGATFTPFV